MAAALFATQLRNVAVKDIVFLPAGRAECADSTAEQQGCADGDENRGEIRL